MIASSPRWTGCWTASRMGPPCGGQGGGRGIRTLAFLRLEAAERPRLNATSIRQLARLGTVVRWPGLLFAAILSLAVPPRSPVGLALVLGWLAVATAWGMAPIAKADYASVRLIRWALAPRTT